MDEAFTKAKKQDIISYVIFFYIGLLIQNLPAPDFSIDFAPFL